MHLADKWPRQPHGVILPHAFEKFSDRDPSGDAGFHYTLRILFDWITSVPDLFNGMSS